MFPLVRELADQGAPLTGTMRLVESCGAVYTGATDATRRTYNQAWWSRIYIRIEEYANEPSARGAYTPFFEALETGVRWVHEQRSQTTKTGHAPHREPATLGDAHVLGSNNEPLVDVKGLEPLTFRV